MTLRRILFVCSMNKLRSPTAEFVARKHWRVDADSAGIDPHAIVPLRDDHVRWADEIVCMEIDHERPVFVHMEALGVIRPVRVWFIEDEYDFMEPRLIALVEDRLQQMGIERV